MALRRNLKTPILLKDPVDDHVDQDDLEPR